MTTAAPDRGLGKRIVFALLAAVLLYACFVVYAGYREIEASLSMFQWSAFAAAIALSSVNYGLRFLKWQYYLRRLGIAGVAAFDSLLVFLSGFVLTVTPGKVGEVFKSAVLKETHGVAVSRSAPIVIAERLTDVIAVITLIVVGSASFAGGLVWAGLGMAAVVLGLVMILWERPGRSLVAITSESARFARFGPKLEVALSSLRNISSPVALLWPIALSIVGWGCEGVALYLLLSGFDASAPLPLCVFFYSTASLAGAIIPVPGGLGVVETMIEQQLVHLAGVAAGPAIASMILVRFATLWWAVLVGFAALAILRSRFRSLRV